MKLRRLILAALFIFPVICSAASKEIVELQRDVAQLQDQVRNLQSGFDTKLAALTVLVQQAIRVGRPRTYSEDFAYYAQKIPGFYVFLGINPPGQPEQGSAPNHSPRFFVDEDAMVIGVRVMSTLAMDFLSGPFGNPGGQRAQRQEGR